MTQFDNGGPHSETLHFLVNIGGSGYHRAAWRQPGHDPAEFLSVGHFQNAARIAENGLLDGLLFPDIPVWSDRSQFGPTPALEPTLLATAIAAVTTNLGLVPTVSTTVNDPYNLARRILSLDHASGGRAGWNVVTTFEERAARNFGIDQLPEREDRYRRAAEFVDVTTKLWDSWEAGALIGNQESAQFADPQKVHSTDHEGEFFSVAGPLNVVRSPQGRPVVVQAGASSAGEEFAAGSAEVVYAAQLSLEGALAFAGRIRTRAAALGRDPRQIRILPGLVPIIGASAAEAQERLAELDAQLVPQVSPLEAVSQWLGIPVESLSADKPITAEQVPPADGHYGPRGFYEAAVRFALDSGLPAGQLARHVLGGHRVVAGTAESIADHIETWWRRGTVDGFTIIPAELPTSLAEFTSQVVPILQERGLFRTEYQGKTLRDSLELDEPVNRFSAASA